MRALDPDPAVAIGVEIDVLWTKPHDLTAPTDRLECELHDEPRLRTKPPVRAVLRDLIVGP